MWLIVHGKEFGGHKEASNYLLGEMMEAKSRDEQVSATEHRWDWEEFQVELSCTKAQRWMKE
jgi:hypothetical protein